MVQPTFFHMWMVQIIFICGWCSPPLNVFVFCLHSDEDSERTLCGPQRSPVCSLRLVACFGARVGGSSITSSSLPI